MLLLIDNYDSFTYNLVQRFGEIDPSLSMQVFRNDQITVDEIEELKPTHIIISPGPCTPREAGISNDVLQRFTGETADPRRLPRPPVHRPRFRRRGDPQRAHHARQDIAGPPRRPRASSPGCRTRSRRRAITAWSSARTA